jgi:hypothetical protein
LELPRNRMRKIRKSVKHESKRSPFFFSNNSSKVYFLKTKYSKLTNTPIPKITAG